MFKLHQKKKKGKTKILKNQMYYFFKKQRNIHTLVTGNSQVKHYENVVLTQNQTPFKAD